MKKSHKILLLVIILVVSIVILLNSFTPICRSHGLQPVQLDCQCNGFEFKHRSMFDILGTSEGTETQCIGKIQSKTCTAGDASVNCDEYSFGFGVVKKK